MSEYISVNLCRYNPSLNNQPIWHSYSVPYSANGTVLGALLYIQENVDSSIAFRYGCRSGRCGLCAMNIDGVPKLACKTYIYDGVNISYLSKLPLIKDLVMDRKEVFEELKKHQLFNHNHDGTTIKSDEKTTESVIENDPGALLRSCLECLSCLSACPKFEYKDESFGGPYIFVKLAQLHLDPRDKKDRIKQAEELGIFRCKGCKESCYCVKNGKIVQKAIQVLIEKVSKDGF